VAVDSSGNVYVADTVNSTIREINPGGAVTTLAGSAGVTGAVNGTGPAALFNHPWGIAVDTNSNLYVADTNNFLIREIISGGTVSTWYTWHQTLFGDAVDSSGNVYAMTNVLMAQVIKITPGGIQSQLNGNWGDPNPCYGVAIDSSGNIYVADSGQNLIREISSGGQATTLAGSGSRGSVDGTGPSATFYSPYGVAVDSSGNVYVADTGNGLIRLITPGGAVTTIAGGGSGTATNGSGATASFSSPEGIAVDSIGNIYVADTGNNMIREIQQY
jgi:sugar lactone lactonase YvrE